MKKIVFLLLLVPFFAYASEDDSSRTVPIVDGKVVFTTEEAVDLTKGEIHDKLIKWIQDSDMSKKITLQLDNEEENTIYCRVNDYLYIEGNAWKIFDMNVRYYLIFEYTDNAYTAKIININFIETSKDDPGTFSAEFVMIEKNYKVLTIRRASEKISDKMMDYTDEVFAKILSAMSN